MELNHIYQGDTLEVLKTFPDECIDCVVSSPPYYGLRDYGIEDQIGLEKTLNEYLEKMLAITNELKRVLKKTGTMWWNHGDSYSTKHPAGTTDEKRGWVHNKPSFNYTFRARAFGGNIPEKCLMLQNYRLAQKMIDEQQWILRNVIIWHKPNCMPSSVKDRFTVDYEPVFFFTKSKKYWFEQQFEPILANLQEHKAGVREWQKGMNKRGKEAIIKIHPRLGRSKRCVWKITTKPYKEAHFATYPPALIEPMIKAGCPEFICKKCGKAREKICDVDYIPAGGKGKNEKYIGKEIEKYTFSFQKMRLGRAKKVESNYRLTDCGCNAGWNKGVVLDPFMGSGTTALVARNLNRDYVGIEISEKYITLAEKRLSQNKLEL